MQIPKSLALTSLAIRVLWTDTIDPTMQTSTDSMAIGGLFTLEILGLPPAAAMVKDWTLRHVTAQSQKLTR